MAIGNFQVQYVLRAYSRQLASALQGFKHQLTTEEVTLSAESRKKLLVDDIVQEIVGQLGRKAELSQNCKKILDRLSQEFGCRLEMSNTEGHGIVFKTLDQERGDLQCIPASQNEGLLTRFYDIARLVVDDDLTETCAYSEFKIENKV